MENPGPSKKLKQSSINTFFTQNGDSSTSDTEPKAPVKKASPAEKRTHNKETLLPISRIRTIMKSSPDVENISQESLFLIAKATEHFIVHIGKQAIDKSYFSGYLSYGDLANAIQRDEALEFLHEIIPKKITGKEYLSIMNGAKED